jgi:hypothetical protein
MHLLMMHLELIELNIRKDGDEYEEMVIDIDLGIIRQMRITTLYR